MAPITNKQWEEALRIFMDGVLLAQNTGEIQRKIIKLEDETRLIVMIKKVDNDLN